MKLLFNSKLFPLFLTFLLLPTTVGCPKVIRPTQPTYAQAVGSGEMNKPLIVDWRPEQRAELEMVMHQGVAVVQSGEAGLKLLSDCFIDGDYGYLGVTKKEQLIRLENAEEVGANLSLSGTSIPADIKAGLSRDATLDVAVVMVGMYRTTWIDATIKDLQGRCEGATHFVRGATVGAFVVKSGSKGEVVTALDVLGRGGSVDMKSEQTVHNLDGNLKNCQNSNREQKSPPDGCSALIRLDLIALNNSTSESDKPKFDKNQRSGILIPEVPNAKDVCPGGFIMMEGKCRRPSEESGICSADNFEDCKKQCKTLEPTSCYYLGNLYIKKSAYKEAASAYETSCREGNSSACQALAGLMLEGKGVTKNIGAAAALYDNACTQGLAYSCGVLGNLYHSRQIGDDPGPALDYYDLGCRGGSASACNDFGVLALALEDQATAFDLFKKSCDGGEPGGCNNLGYMYEFGHTVETDPKKAYDLYEQACNGDYNQCGSYGIMHDLGKGVQRDDVLASEIYELACMEGDLFSCAVLLVNYSKGDNAVTQESLDKYNAVWGETCNVGVERHCTQLGFMYCSFGDIDKCLELYNKGCSLGDEWACSVIKRLGG